MFGILVSPFMNFNVATRETDIIMFNSRNLGALIVDKAPHVRSWDDPQFSITNLGIEESYGFGVLNEGRRRLPPRMSKAARSRCRRRRRTAILIGWRQRGLRAAGCSVRRLAAGRQRGSLQSHELRVLDDLTRWIAPRVPLPNPDPLPDPAALSSANSDIHALPETHRPEVLVAILLYNRAASAASGWTRPRRLD